MTKEPHDPGDARWREALSGLATSRESSAGLETRVHTSLAAQRAQTIGRRSRRAWLAGAALILVAVAGILFSLQSGVFGPAAGTGPRYLLLLYEGSRFDAAGATNEQLVREYGAWAGSLAEQGKLVDASELGNEERLLSGAGESTRGAAGVISGFFIVRAADMAEAAAIAATCPHLKHGGEVAVRPLRG